MADEETKATSPSGSSASNVSVLGIVLICILAVFMVTSLNRMKIELIKMNQQINTLVTTTAQNSIGAFQAVDAEGKVLLRYVTIPMLDMGGKDGKMMGGCSAPRPMVE